MRGMLERQNDGEIGVQRPLDDEDFERYRLTTRVEEELEGQEKVPQRQ